MQDLKALEMPPMPQRDCSAIKIFSEYTHSKKYGTLTVLVAKCTLAREAVSNKLLIFSGLPFLQPPSVSLCISGY
jgi:hypothetical protein